LNRSSPEWRNFLQFEIILSNWVTNSLNAAENGDKCEKVSPDYTELTQGFTVFILDSFESYFLNFAP